MAQPKPGTFVTPAVLVVNADAYQDDEIDDYYEVECECENCWTEHQKGFMWSGCSCAACANINEVGLHDAFGGTEYLPDPRNSARHPIWFVVEEYPHFELPSEWDVWLTWKAPTDE